MPFKNTRWTDNFGEVRVMGVVENYIVARRKGAAPFLTIHTEWEKQFRPIGVEKHVEVERFKTAVLKGGPDDFVSRWTKVIRDL